MNKSKMGIFLKELRINKKMSQPDLAREFAKNYFDVSTNAISSWEKGKSIPDIDKLNFLASYYGVTVDDILDGEKYEEIDFDDVYHIHKPDSFNNNDFLAKLPKDDSDANPVYAQITEEGCVIRKRFKKHIISFIEGDISRKDKEELNFFLENYFTLDESLTLPAYFAFLKQLKKNCMSNDEKWWEAQRYINPIRSITLSFGNISDELFLLPSNQKRMDYSEDWEKDTLLAMIQIADPIYSDPNKINSKHILDYEKVHGKAFNREQIIKNTIRYLIENGAAINSNFLSYEQGVMTTTRVIDTLENAHNELVKPLAFCVRKDGQTCFYYAENNRRNRFFIKYGQMMIAPLKKLGYTYDEIFNIVDKNNEIPDEVYLKMAKLKGINIDREMRYIRADIQNDVDMLILKNFWHSYRTKEYDENLLKRDDLEIFEEELENGIYTNTNLKLSWVGGLNTDDKYSFIIKKKSNMHYSDYKKGRQLERTQELLHSLDSLSVAEIRNKFFQVGGTR